MKRPIVFMFAGQGSQYYLMGRGIYQKLPVFRREMQDLDAVCTEIAGKSVIDELYRPGRTASDPFDNLLLSSLSLILVQHALLKELASRGIEPDFVLGASLGECIAAAAAGAMDVRDLVEAVSRMTEVIQARCSRGGMTAVVHDWSLFFDSPALRDRCQLAARNFRSHFVVSGKQEALRDVEGFLREKGIVFQSLPVSYGFHSTLLDSAEAEVKAIFSSKDIKAPGVPFVSCVDSRVLDRLREDYFWNVLRRPIEFQSAIEHLEERHPCTYVDLGPSGTLATFAKYNLAAHGKGRVFPILTPFADGSLNLDRTVERLLRPEPARRPQIPAKKAPSNTKEHAMKAWVFPGQGSQKKGMGGDLFDRFGDLTARADAVLGYSIKELCLEDPRRELVRTQFTQPALYVVNALTWRKKLEEDGAPPDFVAGHSLGEYNALLASGAFDFETGLRLVQKRGLLMSLATGGAMAAVIRADESEVLRLLKQNSLLQIDVANYNSPSQIVLSGVAAEIKQAVQILQDADITCIPLNVSGAFHSRLMRDAREEFDGLLKEIAFGELQIPVISNVHARPYDPAQIRVNLADQITHPVRWTDSIRYLMGKGEMVFEEVGPGSVLTNLIKEIRKQATPLVIPEEEDACIHSGDSSKPVSTTDAGGMPEASEDAGQLSQTSPHPVLEQEAIGNAAVEPAPAMRDAAAATPSAACGETVAQGPLSGISGPAFGVSEIAPESLGSDAFRKAYGLKYAYLSGSMMQGIASAELVVRMGRAGLMGFLGTAGMTLDRIGEDIRFIQRELGSGKAYGMNLFSSLGDPHREEQLVDLYLECGIRVVEASAFLQVSPALARYRLTGLRATADGLLTADHRIVAKVTRPEVAEVFLSPPPERLVAGLLEARRITAEQAELASRMPMADELCVQADSGGRTDQGNLAVLLPTMIRLRDETARRYGYSTRVSVGAAGGIGTPEAAASAFLLGADFIQTGSINQCTVEAGTSNTVKDILQQINVQDTGYAPAGDMFDPAARVQVVRKGVFFPARANKLHDLTRHCGAWEEIDLKTRQRIETGYFKCSFEDAFGQALESLSERPSQEIEKVERDSGRKLALVFRWYLTRSQLWALQGNEEHKVNYQIHCGPALGAFNQWVKGTELEDWRNRHVDTVAGRMMEGAAAILNERFSSWFTAQSASTHLSAEG